MAPSIHGERARRRGCRGRAPLRDWRREGEGGTMWTPSVSTYRVVEISAGEAGHEAARCPKDLQAKQRTGHLHSAALWEIAMQNLLRDSCARMGAGYDAKSAARFLL